MCPWRTIGLGGMFIKPVFAINKEAEDFKLKKPRGIAAQKDDEGSGHGQ